MERKLRRIPYGTMNWAEVIRECHFVDNTAYIRELEKIKTPVFLRPKRFGKSMVCSMLAHYYDIALKDRFAELFGMTDIGRKPTDEHNAYLMLTFDFSTVQVGTIAQIEERFTTNVRNAVEIFAARYSALSDWSAAPRELSAAAMIDAVRKIIRENHLPPLYVIIDEYDNFTNELVVSNRDAEYDAVCGHDLGGNVRETFFKTFFKSFKAGLSDSTVGRTYFTGVLPITLDDLSSGFNVGTPVQLNRELLGLVGFTQKQVEAYVDDIFAEHDLDPSLKPTVLTDLKRFYDGYRFLPDTEPLYNATICNWYLLCLVSDRRIPFQVIDANVRTDVGWFRRLAQTNENALAKVSGYVERGAGEIADIVSLSAKFGRSKFFSAEFFPYALYYLGLLTFVDEDLLGLPNLTIKNMFVDYYDELTKAENVDAARTAFGTAVRALKRGEGTWRDLFEQYWQHYVKARIPAQAFDKMNENFFRTTFTSRCLDFMPTFFSFETEYNTPEGRCDFLAVPKPGIAKSALLIEFKYYTRKELKLKGKSKLKSEPKSEPKLKSRVEVEGQKTGRAASMRPPRPGRKTPDAETKRQALAYAKAVTAKPDWGEVPLDVVVVEVNSSRGYDWHPIRFRRACRSG